MSDVNLVPLDEVDPQSVAALLDDELLAWESELGWDYREVQQILISFIASKMLAGYVAFEDRHPLGYVYFLSHASKGVIGSIYCAGDKAPDEVVDGLIEAAATTLRNNASVLRIESQVMPFHGLDLAGRFRQQGFDHYARQFLELDLSSVSSHPESRAEAEVVPWETGYLAGASRVAWLGYRDQVDARVCEDYCTEAGCEGYLRSLVETPGCGTFLPAASYVALDSRGAVCGFIIVSKVSRTGAMIPQISVLPSHQGRGLGNALMDRALAALAVQGSRTVGLTVTVQNRRAREWYQREGFRLRKEFGAYVWQRP